MSLQNFISELQQRNLLSERQIDKLRDAAIKRQMSPEALAKFLVTKNHLTQSQATDVLNASLKNGGDVNTASARSPNALDPEATELSLAPIDDSETDESEDAGTSSIFANYLTSPSSKPPHAEVDDELILLTDGDEPADEPAPRLGQISADEGMDEVVLPSPEPAATAVKQESPAARPTVRMTTSLNRSKRKKKDSKKAKDGPKKRTKRAWDSPLMLIGGGGLLLLVLVGGLITWLLNWESGDQKLTQARTARDTGAYSQAIEQYQDFITSSPRHPEHELATVELAMLRIRQPTEAGDFEQALNLAQDQLKEIEDSKEFDKAQGEIRALLPQIAMGLAEQTEKSEPGSPESKKAAELANQALELCNNVTFIPKQFRDEGKLTAVREKLQLVDRRNQSKLALNESVKAMQDALTAGDTNKSYAAYAQLMRTHQELAGDPALKEMLTKTAAAEHATIRFVTEEQAAETAERPTPWIASLATANRRVKPGTSPAAAAAASPNIACIRVDGAVYALDVATGKPLWRRQVGYGRPTWPQLIGADVLITDTQRNEILRVEAQTGRLKWRQAIGEPFAQPLIVGERGFVPANSGKLNVLDLNTGSRLGFLQFPQPLPATPTVDRTNERLYVTGDHSCIYSILLKDLSCLGVHYLGQAPGSITIAPAAIMDKVAVLENDGVETSRLRLLSMNAQGNINGQVADRRLSGLGSLPPLVAGRRLVVMTDRGQIEVYDIGGEGAEALAPVASRAASGSTPLLRYAALADRNIWVADTQLTKYTILPTGNRLPVEAIEQNFAGSTFDQPLAIFGDTLIHARHAKGRAGLIVAATAVAQGRTLWETDLAIPPAGGPVADEANKAFTVANTEGNVFRFDEAAIRSRIQDEPSAAQGAPPKPSGLVEAVDLGNGRAAFCAPGSEHVLLFNPTLGANSAKWIKLDGPLTSPVSALGDGFIAPLTIGQVFYLSSADGAKLAIPFQPTLEPGKKWQYTRAAAMDGDATRFVISDGPENVYLVSLADQPQPHLKAEATAKVGPNPIESPIVVIGDSAIAVAGGSHLVRFKLPSLEPAGDHGLAASAVWGPHRVGDAVLVATANNELLSISAEGDVLWQSPLEHGDIAGAPLVQADSVLIAYKKGVVERRSLKDGKSLAAKDVEQPLATGPVTFVQKLLVAANDGTLLVIDQP